MSNSVAFHRFGAFLGFSSRYGAFFLRVGRRASAALGKVGIRCIDCAATAKAAMDAPDAATSSSGNNSNNRFLWPPAAVSYPFNISGICKIRPN
jgi:hypothetical protein